MKKFPLFLLIALLLSVSLTGCGHVEPAAPESGLVQKPGTSDAPEPSAVTAPDKAGETGDLELLPAEYAENLLSLTDTATGNGISYSILDVQRTKEFGSRPLENLNDLSTGGTDENGNLLGEEEYLFLTIQFTNTTVAVVVTLPQGGVVLYPLPCDELHPELGLMPRQHYIVELRQPAVIALQTAGVDLRRLLHELLILRCLTVLLHLITSNMLDLGWRPF